jgi:polysaccharide export outer membrane protein
VRQTDFDLMMRTLFSRFCSLPPRQRPLQVWILGPGILTLALRIFGAGLILSGTESCTSSRNLVYFQSGGGLGDTVALPDPYVPTVKKGDLLSVQVSSLNQDASAFFNPVARAENPSPNEPNTQLNRSSGYLVADDGTIRLPLVGSVAVEGLTNLEAGDRIAAQLKQYLKEPTVNVRNLNFRISVLGEVARPALFTIPNERITLPEALGLAGDITIYGRRDNVMVIREEGKNRVFKRLNLTQRDAFRSPYYALRPNDIVYVEPGKARLTSADRTYQLAPIVIGILSLIAIIVTRT